VKNNSPGRPDVKFRTNGTAEDVDNDGAGGYGSGASAATIGAGKIAYVLVETDASGIIEYSLLGGAYDCTVTLVGCVR
jgi:hypothetical protein